MVFTWKNSYKRFYVINSEQRMKVQSELQELSSTTNLSSEMSIAWQQANYFARRHMYSDALAVLYKVNDAPHAWYEALESVRRDIADGNGCEL